MSAQKPIGHREWRLLEGDTLLATLQTSGQTSERDELSLGEVPTSAVQLSRFSVLRRDHEVGMVLECPLGKYRIVLAQAAVTAWVAKLGHGLTQAVESDDGLAPESKKILLQWLSAMNALSYEEAGTHEDATLAHWEFHDLLFHAQSRPGRRTGRIQPYRWRNVFEPLPLIKNGMGAWFALPEPNAETNAKTSMEKGKKKGTGQNFWDVLAMRRSRRAFSDDAIPLETLATFLGHSCRVQSQRLDELGGISFRPSPSAGALHGLEIYLLAQHCEGLERGLYHYEPMRHGLERLPTISDASKLDLLAEQARRMAASPSVPPAYFISTARFRRYQWKYAQLAYSVMLKDLGSLHQTMSLCAEALGLASVILGDTPTDPFVELAGLDWLAESPVGSFSLGWAR